MLNKMASTPQMVRAAFTICPTSPGLFDGLSPTVTSFHVTAFGSISLADVDCRVADAAATSEVVVLWLFLIDVELQLKQWLW